MRYSEFKISLSEAQVVSNKYWNDKEGSHEKYITQIRAAVEHGSLFVMDLSGKEVQVVFPDGYIRDNMENEIESWIDKKSNNKGGRDAPVVIGQEYDPESEKAGRSKGGREVKFKLDKITKKFGSNTEATKVNVNMGNVTEGVVGLACAVRFANTTRPVSVDDILDLGRTFFRANTDTIDVPVEDGTDDQLALKITLPTNDITALEMFIESRGDGKVVQSKMGITDDAVKKLQRMIPDAVEYVNTGTTSKNAIDKVQELYQDGVRQVISVVSDGAEAENQNTTKVDLSLIIKGATPDEDYVSQTLSLLSLKAGGGASQVGQVSGYVYNAIRRFWKTSFNYAMPSTLEKSFNDTMLQYGAMYNTKPTKKNNMQSKLVFRFDDGQGPAGMSAIINGPILESYKYAAATIEKHIASGDKGEMSFINSIQKGLLYHTSMVQEKGADGETIKDTKYKGNEEVTVLIMNPGGGKAFVELNFGPDLLDMLSYYDFKVVGPTQTDSGKGVQIRVVATVRTDIDVPPQLQGRLKVSKTEYLVQYRSAIKSNAVRNTVEIGTQAKALANVQEFLQKAPGINSADEIEKADAVVKQKAGQQAAKDAGDDTMGAPDAPEPTASADPNATI